MQGKRGIKKLTCSERRDIHGRKGKFNQLCKETNLVEAAIYSSEKPNKLLTDGSLLKNGCSVSPSSKHEQRSENKK